MHKHDASKVKDSYFATVFWEKFSYPQYILKGAWNSRLLLYSRYSKKCNSFMIPIGLLRIVETDFVIEEAFFDFQRIGWALKSSN